MKTKKFKSVLSRILCIVLIVAMALLTIGCGQKANSDSSEANAAVTKIFEDGATIGEGEKEFTFIVVDGDGNEKKFTVSTDSDTVGAALLENGIIAGDEGQYGLYVKEVNGITADYDTDGVYWAFYINGEYAPTGVDSTDVEPGAEYAFKVEK